MSRLSSAKPRPWRTRAASEIGFDRPLAVSTRVGAELAGRVADAADFAGDGDGANVELARPESDRL
jgi:hypothetical protein